MQQIDYLAVTGYRRSQRFPCEVCEEKHPTYVCCIACNHDKHVCPFCGETLGHSMLGKCGLVTMVNGALRNDNGNKSGPSTTVFGK